MSGGTLRVAQLSMHLARSGGGIFTSICQLSHALAALPGLDVQVFGPEQELASEWSGITPRFFPKKGPGSFAYAPDLVPGLVAAGPDVLHVHGLWTHSSVAGIAFASRTGKPRLVSPHGMLDPWALQNSRWKKGAAAAAFERRHLRGAACLHALCAPEAEAMRAYGLKGPICIIPNGVDLPDQAPPPRHKTGRKTLFYLGRLHPKKGLPDLIQAWKKCRREPWDLVIAGWEEGGHEGALRELAGESVRFPGALYDEAKREAFAQCDAFILPSLSEGLPMVLLEAWASGKPVLMTPQCNLPEGFAAGAAIRIEPGAEGIAQGLEALFAMGDGDREAMGARGLLLVQERFSWPVIAAEMKQVYDWVCGRAGRPASVTES